MIYYLCRFKRDIVTKEAHCHAEGRMPHERENATRRENAARKGKCHTKGKLLYDRERLKKWKGGKRYEETTVYGRRVFPQFSDEPV